MYEAHSTKNYKNKILIEAEQTKNKKRGFLLHIKPINKMDLTFQNVKINHLLVIILII